MVMPNSSAPQPSDGHTGPDSPISAPGFLAKVATASEWAHRNLECCGRCPCPQCKLLALQAKVTAFVVAETLRAAVTGDTTNLEVLVTKVNQLEAKK